ncbi:Sulfur oxidation protein SoxZ [Rhodomicrobium vannielii ATCC 17100]|uniref:Sulfur oxidation protein SoxZ n=1 Tax=Rhodomicrobium vannielii (strain ATCC 17100 / DSM 162 / LMG 4299 / NCIMB 10020 / ATH 3.1.1) TaxID=648757 RepID=E3I4S2_RHOVT|nr:thiosulfate oxidation carrier complex protein SoxZ [Rhodomicrobium vannielii]ADP72744.1 Sulfur oxidation protein SoxZ [Rhodomicrobium vannielii ATCC 17100]
METGLRKDAKGNVLAKRIIERFEASLNGRPALTVDLNRSVAANPYLRLSISPTESGTLALHWTEDTGRLTEKSVAIVVG